jgi:hypothetical protein
MTDPPAGVRWTERLSSSTVGAVLTVWLPAEPGLAASVTGFIGSPEWQYPAPLADGSLQVSDAGNTWTYSGRIRIRGEWVDVAVVRDFPGGGAAWRHGMNASLVIGTEPCDVHLTMADAASLLLSIEPFGAHGVFQRAGAVAAVVGRGIRALAG